MCDCDGPWDCPRVECVLLRVLPCAAATCAVLCPGAVLCWTICPICALSQYPMLLCPICATPDLSVPCAAVQYCTAPPHSLLPCATHATYAVPICAILSHSMLCCCTTHLLCCPVPHHTVLCCCTVVCAAPSCSIPCCAGWNNPSRCLYWCHFCTGVTSAPYWYWYRCHWEGDGGPCGQVGMRTMRMNLRMDVGCRGEG